MASVGKLYPPIVKGTIAPFYTDKETGTVYITVPFIMNKVVSLVEISALSLKIRDAETDANYGCIQSISWTQTIDNPSAVFNLGDPNIASDIARHLVIGRYYKLQIAYRDIYGNDGYFSTVIIAKFTSQPTLSLANFNRYGTNNEISEYVGVYNNLGDTSEKAYQYKFTFRSAAGEVLETSGWRAHNINTDTQLGQSTDSYSLLYNIAPDEKYTMQYSVMTNNGLECNSPRYQIVGSTSIEPELSAYLAAMLDYDNGCVNLRLKPKATRIINSTTKERERPQLTGSFVLSRSSSLENFNIWTKLYTFHLVGQLPEGIIFSDYTVQHGETYRYAIQQYNPYGVYSSKMYAEIYEQDENDEWQPTNKIDILTTFEDMFLYDGEKQLKIRFNPKVSSFKTVLQESKKNTLGAKFPFFFRSGATEYKEFPIAGLISYLSDDNEQFMSRLKDLDMPKDWQNTTDLTDANISYERRFKIGVLDWLNNGKIKLFRSPAEGNYLVRLMNVSLSPNDSLSRMIHSFQSTATEVDSYTPVKLQEYGFLHAEPTIPQQLRFGSINLDDYIEDLIYRENGNVQQALNYMKTHDLLDGFACQYLKMEDFLPQTQFQLANKNYYIGATGQYEIHPEEGMRGLYILNPTRHMSGTISYGVLTAMSNSFNTVMGVQHYDVFDVPTWSDDNYIETHSNLKDRISKIYYMHFTLNDLSYQFATIEEFYNHYGIYLDDENEWQYGGEDDQGNFKKGYTIPLKGTAPGPQAPKFLPEYYYTRLIDNNDSFAFEYTGRSGLDLYTPGSIIHITSTGEVYQYTVNTLENAVIGVLTLIGSTTSIDLHPTKVYIDNDVIDITETHEAYLPMTDDIPQSIKWGPQVTAEFCYQVLRINYGVENNIVRDIGIDFPLSDMKEVVNLSHKYYDARELELIRHRITPTIMSEIRNSAKDSTGSEAFFVWTDEHFHKLTSEEASSFSGSEVWTCFTRFEYDSTTEKYIYNAAKINPQQYDGMGIVSSAVSSYPVGASNYFVYRDRYLTGLEAALEMREQELNMINE